MDPDTVQILGIYGAAAVIVLTMLWIFVPFAIFGIKPLLRELVDQQKRTNELLTQRPPP